MTYDCEICGAVNHVRHYHCGSCGTIPARYSVVRKPIREVTGYLQGYIEVAKAFGAERADRFRTVKHEMRTVPLDYYSEA